MFSRMPRRLRDSGVYNHWIALRQQWELRQWKRDGGRGATPHARKQQILREYANRHGLNVLVETGTYLGFMVWAMRKQFAEIYSLELNEALFRRARDIFAAHRHVHLLQGDSEVVLPAVLAKLRAPALFWLDAHASGGVTSSARLETPIMAEIDGVLRHPEGARHVLLIDDARCFGTGGYPTVEQIRDAVVRLRPHMQVHVAEDIIRVAPPQP